MTSNEIWMRRCAAEEKIKSINAAALGKKFSDVINEITLITGLKVDEGNAKSFALLVSRFLLTYYGMITCSEVTLAFRLNAMNDLAGTNGQGKDTDRIDFYGSNLTIDHIGSVLHRYMQKRANLAQKISGQQQQLEELPPSTEQIDMDDQLFINEYYRKYLANEFSNITLEYAYMVYDSLDKRGMITLDNKQKRKYMYEAQEMRDKELSLPPTTIEERREQHSLMECYLNDALPAEEVERVKRYAKRLVLMDHFKELKAKGTKTIFDV